MRKKLVTFILGLLSMLSLTSCVATVEAQTSDGVYVGVNPEQDINVVFKYGTPYYENGLIIYYLYNGWYYYPHHYHNRYYFRRYARVIPNYRDRRYRPIPPHYGTHNNGIPNYRYKPTTPHYGTHNNGIPNANRRHSVSPSTRPNAVHDRTHYQRHGHSGHNYNRGVNINRSSTRVTVRNNRGSRGRR